ncbi:hypothetical protein Ksed_10950 [Kytococcus sedentarius DSM 20547]|uniref:Uncharacterized protein n=1 Tax=Kytococcus sedentarius (strain ATCC 14392 / DSM 20547 / JCM 11482 / CCUG 33030 / NBRC 15357 / NCTC 11040 / CCM 314 / 541) TaxID=478801 RepID=C7NGM7_KYTSD|nr:hypothetical protein Ksed_10950 [Kytococcus sedentarius DSM 20547]
MRLVGLHAGGDLPRCAMVRVVGRHQFATSGK